jgi:hypothetical protein
VRLDPKVQEQIRAELRRDLTDRQGLIEQETERHQRTLRAIEAKQEKLVQLFYKDLVTEDVFASEQAKLKKERSAAKRLKAAATAHLDDVKAALDLALSRVEQPFDVYRDGTELERRIMNRAIFERIEIGEDGEITDTALTPVYDALSAWQPGLALPARPGSDAGPRRPPYALCSTVYRSRPSPKRLQVDAFVPRFMGDHPVTSCRPGRESSGLARGPRRRSRGFALGRAGRLACWSN